MIDFKKAAFGLAIVMAIAVQASTWPWVLPTGPTHFLGRWGGWSLQKDVFRLSIVVIYLAPIVIGGMMLKLRPSPILGPVAYIVAVLGIWIGVGMFPDVPMFARSAAVFVMYLSGLATCFEAYRKNASGIWCATGLLMALSACCGVWIFDAIGHAMS
jgi:hypothetical protein